MASVQSLVMELRSHKAAQSSQKKKTLTDIENRLVVAKGGGKDWEFGIRRFKLLYIEWISNKVLLYSTGNYTQYPVINHNGKEYKKECTYVHN